MALPPDHLRPIWRGFPNGNGVGTIGLDPREAEFVLENGCSFDGVRYRATLDGWTGTPDRDGRVTVRIERE